MWLGGVMSTWTCCSRSQFFFRDFVTKKAKKPKNAKWHSVWIGGVHLFQPGASSWTENLSATPLFEWGCSSSRPHTCRWTQPLPHLPFYRTLLQGTRRPPPLPRVDHIQPDLLHAQLTIVPCWIGASLCRMPCKLTSFALVFNVKASG